jgi:hypothetical protein
MRHVARRIQTWSAERAWRRAGRIPPPPPILKQDLVRRYGRQWKLERFVETGTYRGDMVAATRDQFTEVVSMEIDPVLHRFACRRHMDHQNVRLLMGDSAELLPTIVARLREPALFWLDAHYSGEDTGRSRVDTPIETELSTILAPGQHDHVILIDDAHEFDGTGDYPSLEEVKTVVAALRPGWICVVEANIIRIHRPINVYGLDH